MSGRERLTWLLGLAGAQMLIVAAIIGLGEYGGASSEVNTNGTLHTVGVGSYCGVAGMALLALCLLVAPRTKPDSPKERT